jgi:hypothetical protein
VFKIVSFFAHPANQSPYANSLDHYYWVGIKDLPFKVQLRFVVAL